MSNKYGPTRGELQFRLALSVAGLIVVAAALVYRGLPSGPGGWEAIGIGTAFFGGTSVWSLWKLIRRDHS